MKPKVAIVVPNWNGRDFINDCLKSLVSQSVDSTIIVVDNGSTDGSAELVKDSFPAVELIILAKNLGFSGGVNAGIIRARELGVSYVALFNNDAVAKRDWIEQLLRAAKDQPKAGIIASKILRWDKIHIDSAGEFMSTHGLSFPRGRNEKDEGQYDKGEYVFGASGGASLYGMKMLKKIGLFDKDYFAYFEDVDISFRAQLAGWKVWYEPAAVAYHHVGGTSSKLGSFARYHSVKNIILLYNRNVPGRLFWKYKVFLFAQLARMLVGSLRDGQLSAYLRGLSKAILLFPKTFWVRRHTQAGRKVSISYIDSILYHKRPPRPAKIRIIK